MSMNDKDTPRALLSLLDRLIDEDPENQLELPPTPTEALDKLREGVRRDVEALLNTRERCRGWPDVFGEIDESVVGYGIPDFSITSIAGGNWRSIVCRQIEAAIRRFEPRLSMVRVTLPERGDRLDRSARFRIDALLSADPAPEPVSFDTSLEPTTRRVDVITGR